MVLSVQMKIAITGFVSKGDNRKPMKKRIVIKKKQPRQLKGSDIASLRAWILKNKQKGLCAICGKEVTDPCLDHSHKKKVKGTGLIRGVLCRNCNTFIAKSENNCTRCGIDQKSLPTILRSCADYLEKPHYPYIHPTEKPKKQKLSKRQFNTLAKMYSTRYPNRKRLVFPKTGYLTKALEIIYYEFKIEPEFRQS